MAVHGERPLVPAFMVHHVEHFNPKWHTQPFSKSPNKMVDTASLRWKVPTKLRIDLESLFQHQPQRPQKIPKVCRKFGDTKGMENIINSNILHSLRTQSQHLSEGSWGSSYCRLLSCSLCQGELFGIHSL